MIKQVRLINWKSFEDAILYIDPLTVLIGSNAGGKSNALDALLFLNRVSQGASVFSAIAGDVSLPPLRGGMEWVCRKPDKRFTLQVITGSENSKQEYRYELTVLVNGVKAEVHSEELIMLTYGQRNGTPKEKTLYRTGSEDSLSPGIPTYFSTGTQGRGKRLDMNRSNILLSQVENLNIRKEIQEGARRVLVDLQRVFVFDPIPSHMRDYAPLSEKLLSDGSNIAGVLAGLEKSRRLDVEKVLTDNLKHLPERDIQSIWTEPVGKFKTDAMLYCREGWSGHSGHEIDARGMSDGTLRYLAIVTALLTRERSSLLVIEEVDNGLHPSRSHILVNMLKSLGHERGVDVLITTHNPALLDAVGIGMIPFITVAHRNEKTGVSCLKQLEDIRQLPKMMAIGSLGQMSTNCAIESAIKQESLD